MSTIAAGTTSGTALVSTGDTSGQLVLQTNGTTTAVTIGTNQVVTLAQPLPVGSGGTGATSLSGITVGTATNATTATNIAGGAQGSVPYQSAAGTTALLAAGTSGQVLTTQGAGANPTWTTPSAGAMVFISTTTASGATNVDITGFTSTYDTYIIDCPNFSVASDVVPLLRFFNAGVINTNNYRTMVTCSRSIEVLTFQQSAINLSGNFNVSSSYQSKPLRITVQRNPDNYKSGASWTFGFAFDTGPTYAAASGVGVSHVDMNLTGVRILDSFGATNCFSGTFKLYGIAKS